MEYDPFARSDVSPEENARRNAAVRRDFVLCFVPSLLVLLILYLFF